MADTAVAVREEAPATVLMSLVEARECVARIRSSEGELRKLLIDFRDREGWRALGHGSLQAWLTQEFDRHRSRFYQQMTAGDVEMRLGLPVGSQPDATVRPLAKLPEEAQKPAYDALAKKTRATGKAPTRRQAEHFVGEVERQLDADLDPEQAVEAAVVATTRREEMAGSAVPAETLALEAVQALARTSLDPQMFIWSMPESEQARVLQQMKTARNWIERAVAGYSSKDAR